MGIYKQFNVWYQENKLKFFHNNMSEDEIIFAAFEEGYKQAIEKAQIDIEKIIKTLKLCTTAIEVIHPHLNPEEPCIAYEAYSQGISMINEEKDHDI